MLIIQLSAGILYRWHVFSYHKPNVHVFSYHIPVASVDPPVEAYTCIDAGMYMYLTD